MTNVVQAVKSGSGDETTKSDWIGRKTNQQILAEINVKLYTKKQEKLVNPYFKLSRDKYFNVICLLTTCM